MIEVDEAFRRHILAALDKVDGEVNLATFSSFFKLYLTSQGFNHKGLKQFARSYGVPKSRTNIRFFKITFRTKSSGDGTDNIRCSYKESMRFLKYPTKKNELTSISVNLFGVCMEVVIKINSFSHNGFRNIGVHYTHVKTQNV